MIERKVISINSGRLLGTIKAKNETEIGNILYTTKGLCQEDYILTPIYEEQKVGRRYIHDEDKQNYEY